MALDNLLNFILLFVRKYNICFPGSSGGKESACNAGDPVWYLRQEDPLEEEMATHSSILTWKIPWTEEPGRLQSLWSQIVRNNLATNTHT